MDYFKGKIINWEIIIGIIASITAYGSKLPLLAGSAVLAQTTDGQKATAERLLDQGNKQFYTSQFEAALDSYQQALKIYQSINDRKDEGDTLGNLGLVYENLGKYEQALDYQKQSLQIAREFKDRLGESQSLGNLGIVYKNLGDYKQAVDYHKQSLSIAREIKDRLSECQSLGNLGLTYDSLGEYKQAIDYYKQSLDIAKEIKNRLSEGNLLNDLGLAYRNLEDYKQAIVYHQQSLDIAREIQDRLGESRSLGNLGVAYRNLGDYKRAIEYYKQSLYIAQEIKNRLGEESALHSLGVAYDSLGDYKQAIEYDKQSLHIARDIKDREGEGISLNGLGESLLDAGLPKAAETNLRGAIAIWESIRADLKNNDAFKVSIFDTQILSYQLLQKALIAENHPDQALEIAERGRARALAELLISRQGLTKSSTLPKIAHIRQIAQQENATLVEYSIAENDLYIWVVKPNGEVKFHSVNLQKIKLENISEDTRVTAGIFAQGRGDTLMTDLVNSTRGGIYITSESRSKIPELNCGSNCRLRQMYDLLIKPIASELPTNPDSLVVFIPHESLFLIPFAALQDEKRKFLIEKHTLAIAPSIEVLELTHAQKAKLPSVNSQDISQDISQNLSQNLALVVGNPIMPKIGDPPQQLPSLPGAESEAKSIAQLLKTQPLIGGQATKTAVEAGMKGVRFIHLATHGLLEKNLPGEIPGKIALAPAGIDDGFLKANEILKLNLNADLVVLSACNTGRGKITGDGVIGLSRVFISAGVPSVVVSLWSVGDNSTAELMQEFYTQLHQNLNKSQALRRAILKTKQDYPQPKDWAAFVLIGESE